MVDANRRSFTSIGFSSTTKGIGPHSRAAPASTCKLLSDWTMKSLSVICEIILSSVYVCTDMPPFAGKALKPVVRLSVNADSGAVSHSRADILRLHANDSNHSGRSEVKVTLIILCKKRKNVILQMCVL